ncbi:TPA: hypothetical protein ACX8DN_000805, partial [Campylobacter coli]
MKITMIILSLFSLVFLSTCAFKEKKASEIETLASNYGGIYIFDKKIREEILELEKKEEFRSKYLGSEIKVGNETHFVNFSYLK